MQEFKTESKKVMDLMINSIYTNKEIFLREIISNASDAIDKLYYGMLQKGESGFNRNDFKILIKIDKKERTLTITDNGIGMTKNELENNLGVIAKSGSQEFKTSNEKIEEVDIIGQFGVGFYSSFMVSKKVQVSSKAYGEENAFMWVSEGSEGYEIKGSKKTSIGTEIKLYIKDNTEDENYDKYLEEYEIRRLIKKYSDYIRYAINLETIKKENETENFIEETLNSRVPLWKKNKNEITKEECDEFFKNIFNSQVEPLDYLILNLEGKVDFKAILFIPKNIPYGYYTKDYEKGLKLYTNGVMITEKCEQLLPDYLNFVKGVVDADLQLNISRETLQDSKDIKLISNAIEDKVRNKLLEMMKEDKDKYVEFFKEFGLQLKYSIYREWGMNKDKLQDLLIFYSLKNEKYISLEEYVNSMNEDQKSIYYAYGVSKEMINSLPQVENLLDKNCDVICMTDEIDEFVIKFLFNYKEKEFLNALNVEIDKENEIKLEEDKELLDYLNEICKEEVEKIKLSNNLKNHPVTLSAEGEISLEMERVVNANPANPNKIHAVKVLEINVNHKIFEKIKLLYKENKDKLKDLIYVLANQAKLVAGLPIEKPSKLTSLICDMI